MPMEKFVCSLCRKEFRSKDTLRRHELSHSGSKPFFCDECKTGFSSAVSLREHKARHEDRKLYECSSCSKEFRQNSSYRRHLLTHSKSSVHVCQVCQREFSRSEYLKSHEKVHTGVRPHPCLECPKTFSHLSDLNRHKIIHMGVRPYKCSICGASFADRSSHRRHVKNHEQNVYLTCNQCSALFKNNKQLKLHFASSHPNVTLGVTETVNSQLKDSIENVPIIPADNNGLFESAVVETIKMPENVSSPNNLLHLKEVCNPNAYDETSLQVSDLEGNPPCQDNAMVCHEIFTQCYNAPSKDFQSDYIFYPNFENQDYYNWLSDFTFACKSLAFPIDSNFFIKISQVYKTIVDSLAHPPSILQKRTNFMTLFTISKQLLEVTNDHMKFVHDQLQD